MKYTKEQTVEAAKFCAKTCGACPECEFRNVSCDRIFADYIVSTENETLSQVVEDLAKTISDSVESLAPKTTEKEPASAGTLTSSKNNDIKTSTDMLALSEDNVKLIAGILNLATDTLDQIYKADDFDKMSPTLSVGFGRAWAMVDIALSMMIEEDKNETNKS